VRVRLLIATLGILALAALVARGTGRGAAWAPFPPPARPVAARPPNLPSPPPTRRTPSRNLFEYANEVVGPAPAARWEAPRPPSAGPEAPAPSPSPAVRVAGLIRRGGELKAALVVEGEVIVAGKGERAGGYTVVDVDDETGVRLRGPDGEEIVLPPPPF
jgi:hypothetical protein